MLVVDRSNALVPAFVSCRLDYCNSLFFGISDGLMSRLQSVQNAAARLVTATRRCDHINAGAPSTTLATGTPARRFEGCHTCSSVAVQKFCVILIAIDCRLVAEARERRLRSTESRTCVVTRTNSIFGDRAFAAAGPGLWNSLPPHLRDADLSYSRFRLDSGATAHCEPF